MSKGSVYKPSNLKDFKDGLFRYFSRAKLRKDYENELPAEEKFFYDSRPGNFKVLKELHIDMKNFCLIVNLFNNKVTYVKYKEGEKFFEKEGELLSYWYL